MAEKQFGWQTRSFQPFFGRQWYQMFLSERSLDFKKWKKNLEIQFLAKTHHFLLEGRWQKDNELYKSQWYNIM